MPRKVKNADGKTVTVHPHAPDGRPDYGHPDNIKDHGMHRRMFAYQDMIQAVLDDNDLWQYMNEAGRMSMEYAAIRKSDPLMPTLVGLVKISVAGKLPHRLEQQAQFRELVPEEYWNYPFPGPIMRKLGVENADYLIAQEMKDLWAFALENINEDPTDPNSKMFKQLKGLSDVEQARLISKTKVRLYRDDEQRNKIIIPGGCAVRFTLFDDPELPREHETLRLVKYDHTNPKHNPALRTDATFVDMRDLTGPPAVPHHRRRKEMTVEQGQETG